MDKQLPDDFDPYGLEEPMQTPGKRSDKRDQDDSAPKDEAGDAEILLPMLHALPPRLKRFLFTGSCCAGVAVLYVISAWDHGLIPRLESPLAQASDVTDMRELIIRSLAREIRDLSVDNCALQSRALDDHIESLQLKYKARTGDKYPHTECKKL